MHTYSLLTEHADRSTIALEGLALLDKFLAEQRGYQRALRLLIKADTTLTAEQQSEEMILEHFRLLQACDNLSLLSCVAFDQPAHLLHRLPLNDGDSIPVQVRPEGLRRFRLDPWPFAEAVLTFAFPARHVVGKRFASSRDLQEAYLRAPEEELTVTLLA